MLRLRQARSVSEAVAQIQCSFAPAGIRVNVLRFFTALAFSGRTTGRAGTLRGFANKDASLAPAASPISGARRIGLVINANLRKKIPTIFGQALDRKILLAKFKRSGE